MRRRRTGDAVSRWDSLEALLQVIGDTCPPFEPPVTVNSRRSDDDTPLHVAAVWGDVEAIEMLIRAGADVNAVGDMGCTPLHDAVIQGHIAAAGRLLAAGATPFVRSEFGTTAADEAMRSGNPELASLFSRRSSGQ
jgi:ankyrin repeat protein